MQTVLNDLNQMRIQHFQNLVKDAQPITFNTNVFKKAKLAMKDEEIKFEEEKVRDLSKFIKQTAIPNMLRQL